jgi:hypothetical protein
MASMLNTFRKESVNKYSYTLSIHEYEDEGFK